MNRWKREPTVAIRTMHAHHHRYSHWHECVLIAAEELGLNVGFYKTLNHSDDSTDRIWYVSAAALERVGGIEVIHEKANLIQQAGNWPIL